MRIKKLIPLNDSHYLKGLKFKEMRDLKKVVVLFGKNGSGKTRLLDYIPHFIGKVSAWKNAVDSELIYVSSDSESYVRGLEEWEKETNLLIEGFSQDGNVIRIRPEMTGIEFFEHMNESFYRQEVLSNATNPEYQSIRSNAFKLIKALFKAHLAAKYASVIDNKSFYKDHDVVVERLDRTLERVQFLVENFTGKKITCEYDEMSFPVLIYDGRPLNFGFEKLSSGELELIVMAVYLAFQENTESADDTPNILKNKLILIDEPELYLHPEAQIKIFRKLKELVCDGQIWIATHSLPLLSVLDKDEIWLLKDGEVKSPSIETPGEVISELIGEGNIDNLENLISSQYEWAGIQFALESLFPPAQVPHKKNDPQQEQVIEYLGVPLEETRILDFGAGTGRIGLELMRNPSAASKVYYQALEEGKSFHSQLRNISKRLQVISTVDSGKEREVLDTYMKLLEREYKQFFDVVLLVNVLHEIKISKWEVTMKAILNSLKENGKILILEDQNLPKGENAHEHGYLILDIEEFKKLFSLKETPVSRKHGSQKYEDRLMCIEVMKADVELSRGSIKEALDRKKTNCKQAIAELKKKAKPDSRDGRKYQFYSQLYFNVDTALSEEFSD